MPVLEALTKPGRARLLRLALCATLLCLAAVAHGLTALAITDVQLDEGGRSEGVTLPFSEPSTGRGPLTFRMRVHAGLLPRRSLVIVPDDHFVSLSINGQEVSLAGVPPEKLDDYQRGFVLDVGPRLAPGDNVLVARVVNGGGPGGLDLRPDPVDPWTLAEGSLAAAALLALLGEALRARGVRGATIGVTLTALAVRAGYLWVTPYQLRQHDADEHLEYVAYLLAHRALPSPNAGYAFYHPPLYYVLCALQWAALSGLGVARSSILVSLQVQSAVYELGFAALSIAAMRLWLDRLPAGAFGRGLTSRPAASALLAGLVLLWPASVVHAVRVGNDDLAYLFFAGGLYFAGRWWLDGRDRDLRWAAVFGALGVVTKTNDALVFGVLLLSFVARLAVVERERRPWAYVRRGWLPVALLVASLAAALGTAVRDRLRGQRPHLLIANADWNSTQLIVGDHAKNFLWLDVWTFVAKPFTSAWDDAMGRQWFWNYALKTSLFGEFSYEGPWLARLATIASALLLVLLVVLVGGLALRRRRQWLDELPLELTVVLSVASLAMLRMSIPRACSGDFRYILPIVGPCAYGYVRAVTLCRARGWRWLATSAAAVAWGLLGVAVAFFAVLTVTGG